MHRDPLTQRAIKTSVVKFFLEVYYFYLSVRFLEVLGGWGSKKVNLSHFHTSKKFATHADISCGLSRQP